MKDRSKKPPKEPHGLTEAALDEALIETFPASDPPSTSPTTVGRVETPHGPGRAGGKKPPRR
jgi:hypothetical protein